MVDGDQGDISPTLRDFVINNIRIGNQIGRGNELECVLIWLCNAPHVMPSVAYSLTSCNH